MHYYKIYRNRDFQYISFDESFKAKLEILNENDMVSWTYERCWADISQYELLEFLESKQAI